jgi:hypothetical protein
VHAREDGEHEGLKSVMNEVINALAPPLGESPGGLFIGAIRGTDNNVRTTPLTAPFRLDRTSIFKFNS